MTQTDTTTRPVQLTRAGGQFRLTFAFDRELNDRVRRLPQARFVGDATWETAVCEQSVQQLRGLFAEGFLDVGPDDLLDRGEEVTALAAATLIDGTRQRPFAVEPSWQDERLRTKLAAVTSARWDDRRAAFTYMAHAAAELAELVERGTVDDPDGRLSGRDALVAFDSRSGRFRVFGDERAQAALDRHFPDVDLVAVWRDRDLDVAFADPLSEEVYRGERARVTVGQWQPDGLAFDLYPFQRENVAVATERSGILVGDEPGLGKTATGIAAAHERLANRGEVDRVLVACPGAVRSHWASEITRFTGDESIVVIDGDKRQREEAYDRAADARWVIFPYHLLPKDDEYQRLRELAAGAYLVADEVHWLKNPTSSRTKRTRELNRRAVARIGLTGTPLERDPGEWHAVLSGFSSPGVLGDFGQFSSRYMYRNPHGGYHGRRNIKELASRSRPHFLRHRKVDVATHLPPLRVQHLPLDAPPALASVLRRLHQHASDELATLFRSQRGGRPMTDEEWDDLTAQAEMTAVSMLRYAVLSPRLLAGSGSASAEALLAGVPIPSSDGPKVDEVRTIVGALADAGQRAVVFSFSRAMVDLLAERLTEDGRRVVTYTGETSSEDRDAAVAEFTDPDSDVAAFIATDAGSEGLNLGRACSTLINVDIPWTPTRLEQRINRIHRLDGTAERYLAINLTVSGTVEDGILAMVSQRADLMDAVFAESDGRARTVGAQRTTSAKVIADLLRPSPDASLPADGLGAMARDDDSNSGDSDR